MICSRESILWQQIKIDFPFFLWLSCEFLWNGKRTLFIRKEPVKTKLSIMNFPFASYRKTWSSSLLILDDDRNVRVRWDHHLSPSTLPPSVHPINQTITQEIFCIKLTLFSQLFWCRWWHQCYLCHHSNRKWNNLDLHFPQNGGSSKLCSVWDHLRIID